MFLATFSNLVNIWDVMENLGQNASSKILIKNLKPSTKRSYCCWNLCKLPLLMGLESIQESYFDLEKIYIG